MTRPELNTANQARIQEARERLETAMSKPTLAEAIAVYSDKASLYRAARRYQRTKEMQLKFGTQSRGDEKRAAILEDADFLARVGEHPQNAARRLGFNSAKSLETYLGRAGGDRVMARLWANDRSNDKGSLA